jgi:hypothetical protein
VALPVLAVRLVTEGAGALEVAAAEVSRWIRARHGLGVEPFTAAQYKAAGDIPDLVSRVDEDATLGRVWSVQVSHPGDDDPTWLWRIDIWVVEGRSDAESELTTRVSVESLQPDRISAPNVAAGRPAFVGAVIEALTLKSDGIGLQWVNSVTRNNAASFVEFLDRGDRRLPVVAISERRGDGAGAEQRAEELLERLGGIAHVAHLAPSGSWELSERVPEGGGCFAGAVRIYWPGTVSTDPIHRHPLFVSKRIEQVGWEAVRREIVERIGTQSAASIGVPQQALAIRRAVRAQARETAALRQKEREQLLAGFRARDAQVRALKEQLADAAPTGSEADVDLTKDVLAELEAQLQENESLGAKLEEAQLERDLAQDENEDLKVRLATAERNLRDVYLSIPGSSQNEASLEDLDVPDLLAALQSERGALWLTDNALRSWQRSPSANPDKVKHALLKFRAAAQAWRDADTSIGNQLNVWLANEYGLDLATSDEPLKRHGKDTFAFEGQTWSQEWHLKLGDNTSPENVARVYFALDTPGRRWIINHVGLKLYGL